MTAQHPDTVWYEGRVFPLMGYTNSALPTPENYGIHFDGGWSTGDYRGHIMQYKLADKLILRRIEVRGFERQPITHSYIRHENEDGNFYDLNTPLEEFTGFILFSSIAGVHWLFKPEIYRDDFVVYEAEVSQGRVLRINDVTGRLKAQAVVLENRPPEPVNNPDQNMLDPLEKFWDDTTALLSRRYDVLYFYELYAHFQLHIESRRKGHS